MQKNRFSGNHRGVLPVGQQRINSHSIPGEPGKLVTDFVRIISGKSAPNLGESAGPYVDGFQLHPHKTIRGGGYIDLFQRQTVLQETIGNKTGVIDGVGRHRLVRIFHRVDGALTACGKEQKQCRTTGQTEFCFHVGLLF